MKGIADDINKGFDGIERTASQRQRALDFGKAVDARGGVKAAERYKQVIAGFAKTFEENQTPLDQYHNKLKELDLFLQGGGNWDVYARGVSKAVAELEKAHGLSEIHLPAGLTRNSSAAVSAINQQENLNERRFRESPQDRLNRILSESKEIEKQQLEYQRRMADALTKAPQEVHF
jgi:hypothetical protein